MLNNNINLIKLFNYNLNARKALKRGQKHKLSSSD